MEHYNICSSWPYFKFGVKNEVYRNGILFLAGKGSGTLHFLCILAHTDPFLNLGVNNCVFVMVFFC